MLTEFYMIMVLQLPGKKIFEEILIFIAPKIVLCASVKKNCNLADFGMFLNTFYSQSSLNIQEVSS